MKWPGCFDKFWKIIKDETPTVDETYFHNIVAKNIIYKRIDSLLKMEGNKGHASIICAYTLALLSLRSQQKLDLNYEAKLKQFDNTLIFFSKLRKLCLSLKTLTLPSKYQTEGALVGQLLKSYRKKYLVDKLWKFNEAILNTFPQDSKNEGNNNEKMNINQYIGYILPFNSVNRKVIINFLPEYSFLFTTKERIPIKISVECVNVEELEKVTELNESKENAKKILAKSKEENENNILDEDEVDLHELNVMYKEENDNQQKNEQINKSKNADSNYNDLNNINDPLNPLTTKSPLSVHKTNTLDVTITTNPNNSMITIQNDEITNENCNENYNELYARRISDIPEEVKTKMNQILENVKYENEHPNETIKNEVELTSKDLPENTKEISDNIFNPFNNLWENSVKEIKIKSSFKMFSSLSVVSFIAKAHDDLRQEVMTMQMIKKFDEIFKEENIPLKLRPYEIVVTSRDSGLVEYLPDTISMDALKKALLKNDMSFDYFFKCHFGDDFEEHQKTFTESLAAYSLVCYLIAIKDRHNGNILLDKEGALIHIDFGFVLGISPGGNMNFENAPFKLTKDYVRLMDGTDSSIFEYFRSLFLRGLLAVRKHVDIFCNIVEAMFYGVPMPCFTGKNIKDIIVPLRERFLFKYSDTEIVSIAHNLIDRSLNSWRTTQYDMFQKFTNDIQP